MIDHLFQGILVSFGKTLGNSVSRILEDRQAAVTPFKGNAEYPVHRSEHHGRHTKIDDLHWGNIAFSRIGFSKKHFSRPFND